MSFLALVATTAEHAAAASEEHGPWVFGWEALVAIGTLLLAVYTARLALFTRRSVAAARDEQSGAWRPVVLPLAEGSSARELDEGDSSLTLQIVNVGRGPAFDVALRLALEERERLVAPTVGTPDSEWTYGILREQEVFRVRFYVTPAANRFGELTIICRDLGGRPVWTTAALHWVRRASRDPAGASYAVQIVGTESGYGTVWPFEESGASELSRRARACRWFRTRLRPAG